MIHSDANGEPLRHGERYALVGTSRRAVVAVWHVRGAGGYFEDDDGFMTELGQNGETAYLVEDT